MKKSLLAAAFGMMFARSTFSAAQAQERFPRWYLGLTGSYTIMSDQDISGGTAASNASFDSGYGYGGSIGYLPSSSSPFLNALRFEVEVTHHRADIDKVTVSGSDVAGRGEYSTTAYMANVFYDFQSQSAWSPYIGAGVGVANVHVSNNSSIGNTENSTNEFAYQGLAGIGYSPATLPNTQWTLGYRYLATSDATFAGGAGGVKTEYSTHNVEVGAKFRF